MKGRSCTIRLLLQRQLSHWIAAVDEQPAVGCQRSCNPPTSTLLQLGMSPVQRAHSYGEREIVRSFAGLKLEILSRHLAQTQASGSDLSL